ncbi:6-phosphofructokinase [Bacillus sp. SLBN-46]|uniref:diphosphate--fructose-6-phosphate 1-phosphotransferase n=1 Tax=Bacillus sp. SLBN-46 TaxID=3042283 RepID=UPI002861595B|nr:diphosphate--fructose-6-phosphate 1-phosphotransferase [Bacillus sp. SLBN-46]MDR6124033.1 6-phosphofructokinase [Bacillus sp. SLBN-46]
MSGMAIGQAGGPTAVINLSVIGFLENLSSIRPVYAVMNGYEGLARDYIVPLQSELLKRVQRSRDLPGACLGAGRFLMDEEKIETAVRNLEKKNITTLVFIGGNGTMAALHRISEMGQKLNIPLQVIGIPKTVDNDLAETDHAPGFASAAKYVAYATRDISYDLAAMSNFEQVRVIETMGRNAGWLALAAGYLKRQEQEGPHLIYVPEVPIKKDRFLDDVHNAVNAYGTATVVVSEGAVMEGWGQVEQGKVKGRSVLGGLSFRLKEMVNDNLGYFTRVEMLGMNQRSSSLAVSAQDRHEAYEIGHMAADFIKEGKTNVMVSIKRRPGTFYQYDYCAVPLHTVANTSERLLPYEYLHQTKKYYEWLSPLISSDYSQVDSVDVKKDFFSFGGIL